MVTQNGIDFMWLLQTFTNTTPLYYGYLSRYVRDHPPCTLVTYVDPISLPLTKNDVVSETMVRSIQVSKEMIVLDRCLTSSLVQFVAYFKYKIIEAYHAVCNIRNCYICQ